MKKNIVITILILLVLGLGCFIVYDKIMNKDEKKDIDIVENSEEKNSVLDTDTALYIGNELYSYAKNTISGTALNSSSEFEEGKGYLVYNYDEIVSHFSDENKILLIRSGNSENFKSQFLSDSKGNYYLKHDPLGRGVDTSYQKTDLKVKSILEDKITFEAVSQYCSQYEGDPYPLSKCISFENKTDEFVIVKESGKWKISSFVMPY